MRFPIRTFAPALVLIGALLSACGASSVSDVGVGVGEIGLAPEKHASNKLGSDKPPDASTVGRTGGEAAGGLPTPLTAGSAPTVPAPLASLPTVATKPALGVAATTAASANVGTRSSTSAKASADALTAVAMPGNAGYKIGPLDVLDVSVFKVPDLTKAVQVTEAGTVNYPLIGELQAAGKTAREVEQLLTSMLGAKYLQKPQVTVFIKEYNSQRVTIEGAIIKPGVYPISGNMTLLQAIATAQGFTPNSDASIVLFRMTDGKRAAARFDLDKIRDGSEPDPAIKAGDVIVAGNSAIKENFNNVIKLLPLASIFALL
jgi:polysaccharide biosynthesis/export protein